MSEEMTKSDDGLRVVELRAESFMGIKLAEVKPTPTGLVVIGGNNGQGKTSLLNAIECALRGKKYHPGEPVRHGSSSAQIDLDLGDLKIRRRFTPNGSGRITVDMKDGMRPRRPQELLDTLANSISFDPFAFSRMTKQTRVEFVKKLAGLDFAKMKEQYEYIYAERKATSRQAKMLRAQAEGMQWFDGAPEEDVSQSSMMERMTAAEEEIEANEAQRAALSELEAREDDIYEQADAAKRDIEALEARLELAREGLAEATKSAGQMDAAIVAKREEVEALIDPDIGALRKELREIAETNDKVLANRQRKAVLEEAGQVECEAKKLSAQMEELKSEKAKQIAAADLPVSNMSFNEERGVLINDTPFEQLSSSEQIKASAALAIAMHPKLRVMLIRDGSLLDPQSMELLAGLAHEHGYQVWVERVGGTDAGAIVIEDGEVSEGPLVK